ncbi:MAG: NAD(P)/FAD-dependent oxidoreductase, partial [Clostridiales bacterium]|nr:NAD(P)/FAD-dependent oxidoreductase [Clostridiales bacterium]
MRITIIGAGQGGLTAACFLAKGGHEVAVYEKNARDALSYDWHDDAAPSVFQEFGIPLPSSDAYFTKRNWSFVGPFSDKWCKLHEDAEKLDYSFERRLLSSHFVSLAESAGANCYFESPVEALIMDENRVKGVVLDGKEIFSELVIDSSGVFSKFRASLPENFGIPKEPGGEGWVETYRAFFEPREGASPDPENTNRGYVKYLGKKALAWVIQDPPTGQINVLVCKVGGFKEGEFDEFLRALKEENPIIGDKVLRGGTAGCIPVRYPADKMVADGYAVVGDAAFMTTPMIGSGIASSTAGGAILADTVNQAGSAETAALWDYQVRFMKRCGAKHTAIDIMKRMLLNLEDVALRYVFESGVMSEKDLIATTTGDMLVLTLSELFKKLIAGIKDIPTLLKLNDIIA